MATKKSESGQVELRMINPKRTGTIILTDYKGEDGRIKELHDANGQKRIVKYTSGLKILNLDDKTQYLEYLHIKDHPIFVKGSSPVMRVVNVTKDAEDEVQKKTTALDALIIAKDLQGQKLADFARILGIQTENTYESVIKKAVFNQAENDPIAFLSSWEDPLRPIKSLIYKGRARGVFKVVNGAWKYKNVVMGTSIDHCLKWISENEDLLPSIRKEVNSLS